MEEGEAGAKTRRWTPLHDRIVALLGVAIGAVALLVAALTMHDTRRIAEQSGSLDKEEIAFGFGNFLASNSNTLVIAVISQRCTRSPVYMELPLTVVNKGNKVASDVQATLEFPLDQGTSPAMGEALGKAMENSGPPVSEIKRSTYDAEKRRYVDYKISKLFPHMSVTASELMQAPLPLSIDIHQIDKRLIGEIKVDYSLEIPLRILTDGGNPVVGLITLATVRANSLAEAQPSISKVIDNSIKKRKQDTSFLAPLFHWLVPNSSEAFVLYPDDSSCGSATSAFTQTQNASLIKYTY